MHPVFFLHPRLYPFVPVCSHLYPFVPVCTRLYPFVPVCTRLYPFVPVCTRLPFISGNNHSTQEQAQVLLPQSTVFDILGDSKKPLPLNDQMVFITFLEQVP